MVLILLFLTFSFDIFAQAPKISYQTPQVYAINSPITTLDPKNTGGAVPATIYGQVTTFAGSAVRGAGDGTGIAATFNSPTRLGEDVNGNAYVADRDNGLIRKITPAGVVTTFASGFNQPNGVAVDKNGNVYVADAASNSIKKITPAGVVTLFAGGNQGSADGTGAAAGFYYPYSVTLNAAGDVYVADSQNNLIREITPGAVVTTFAGNGASAYADGQGAAASFNEPSCVNTDVSGNIYVADINNSRIRKITPSGLVSTIAGNSNTGNNNGVGIAATFDVPEGVATDLAGNIYVADIGNNLIRKIDAQSNVTTLAGTLTPGAVDGVGINASFNRPNDVQADPNGFLLVTDYGNNEIRKIIVTGYTIDKTLPAGLIFDPETGIISGTPTVTSPSTNYTVTAYNINGSSSTVVNITVLASGFSFPPIPAKAPCDVDFDPGATGGSGTFTYTSSNSAVATIIAGKIHIVGPGTTNITANDGSGPKTQLLTVAQYVNPSVSVTPNGFGSCQGISVTYTATAVNGGINPTYQWKVNGQPVGTNSTTFTSSTLNTGDIITCTLTNNSDCTQGPVTSNNATLTAAPYTTPTLEIQAITSSSVPAGSDITFTATPTNGGTNPGYQWQINGASVGTNSPIFTSNCFNDGDIVTCIVTYESGQCVTTLTATSNPITVTITNQSIVTISASATTVYSGTPVTFTAITSANPVVYQWMVNGKDAGNNNPVFVSTTLNNGDKVTCAIFNDSKCNVAAISNEITITILPPSAIKIPNAFTPNGDGINDLWNIPDLAFFQNCTVNIYNRYGILIYNSRGYSKPWDGTYNGSKVPVSTYYYVIDLGTKSSKLGGSVTVIR